MFIIPQLGKVQQFLSKPVNFIIAILIPALLVIGYDLIRIFGQFQKSKFNY
jgi:hypothetical protein